MKRLYPWKRFWYRRGDNFEFGGDGYLLNPQSEYGRFYSKAVPFETMEASRCLVLLGEPGIGKTSTMRMEWESFDARVREKGDSTLWLSLSDYASERYLQEDLFESDQFNQWSHGQHHLHLFLDGLDEGQLVIPNLGTALARRLEHVDCSRLHLRLTCRVMDWPHVLEERLTSLFGHNSVGVFVLAPLRREDVVQAAKLNNLDPNLFIAEVDRFKAVPLAIKPLTLDFLMRTFAAGSGFPSSRVELYEDGCRRLCQESNDWRIDEHFAGRLSDEQRLAVAARIAAVTVFGRKAGVAVRLDPLDASSRDVLTSDLIGHKERVKDIDLVVDDGTIMEALRTGLFTSRGKGRLGWAHQSYAEFLAAWYVSNLLAFDQLLSLIVNPHDPERKVVPQLHEVAAWLSDMQPRVLEEILKIDPPVLLQSRLEVAGPDTRVRLVQRVLELFDEEKLADTSLKLRQGYENLAHPTLAGQLRQYIGDSRRSAVARRAATDIAEACRVTDLREPIVELALDAAEETHLRINAVHALKYIANVDTKARLKPLAVGEAGADPADELKGIALRVLWPSCLSVAELLALLAPPKNPSLLGLYYWFLSYELADGIAPADLPLALEWARSRPVDQDDPPGFRNLASAIAFRAWTQLDTRGVLDAFVQFVLARLVRWKPLLEGRLAVEFTAELRREDFKRRQLIEALLLALDAPERGWQFLATSREPLVLAKDVRWLLQLLRSSEDSRLRRGIGNLIVSALDKTDSIQVEEVIHAAELPPAVSEVVDQIRVAVGQALSVRTPSVASPDEDQEGEHPVSEEVLSALTGQVETLLGTSAAPWLDVAHRLQFRPDGSRQTLDFDTGITELDSWKALDAGTRAKILTAAETYLGTQDAAATAEWLGKGFPGEQVVAGYAAFRLLLRQSKEHLLSLPAAVWREWAPAILACPFQNHADAAEDQSELVCIAYQSASWEILETLSELIRFDNAHFSDVYLLNRIQSCWDQRIGNVVFNAAQAEDLKLSSFRTLLASLLDHDSPEARHLATSLIAPPAPSDQDARARVVAAAVELWAHPDANSWAVLWHATTGDPHFGRDVIASIAARFDDGSGRLLGDLSEAALADLYIWLEHQFPHAEDPKGEREVSERGNIGEWRNLVLAYLQEKGSFQAAREVERIALEFPTLRWLRWTLLKALDAARWRVWQPVTPADLLAMARDTETRLVRSGSELLAVIHESLRRLNELMHDETPAVPFLWDHVGGESYKPKPEIFLSDLVKIHLDYDIKKRGIVVNREVEIHRSPGANMGERTDIHVDAATPGHTEGMYRSVKAIIEVKGCWNDRLDKDMREQLVDRYLKDNRCQHGIYLIGWYYCDYWKKPKGTADFKVMTLNQAREHFDGQATARSVGGVEVKAFVLDSALRSYGSQ